jgi:hypothetical protein
MRRPHPTGSDFARIGEVEVEEERERGERAVGVWLAPGGVKGREFFRICALA